MMYEPAEDSYLLSKHVRKVVSGKVLDMGTGSGIQAMAALERTEDVKAVDINPEAVAYAKKKGIDAFVSDLFENVEGKFDWIIFNPPYLPEDPDEPEDSKLATTGGKEGGEILKKFLVEAKKHLTGTGKILVLVSSLTGKPEELFEGYRFECLETEDIFMEKLSVYLLSLH
jgi:release factor glutamine methyltransferase